MSVISEDLVEQAAIQWLGELGYAYKHGPQLAPNGATPERTSLQDVILEGRLRTALTKINPHLSAANIDEAIRMAVRSDTAALVENNYAFQRRLLEGVKLQVRKDGAIRGDQAWLIDFTNLENNDWLVVNQLTVKGPKHTKRPDLVVYVNGLPLAVIELKDPKSKQATIQGAYTQLQNYKAQIPALFAANELLVVSDGIEARVGSLTSPWERMGPWRTVDGDGLAPAAAPKLEVLLKGVFEKRRLLDYVRNFVLWETEDGYVKKIAGYHQYHATLKAVAATVKASRPQGDRRIGVVWHTQGSGKSISMVFYTAKIMQAPAMENPTIVVVTDRNDLDGQLYEQFCAAKSLFEAPVQAEDRDHVRRLLRTSAGGIVFTTMQKWAQTDEEKRLNQPFPALSDRRNIVVIADEAHRSQYGFATKINRKTGAVTRGFAKNLRDGLPNASFIGFTGTPIQFDDKSTQGVFGDYIDTYTISQAVADNATKPIHYEARQAMLDLPEDELPVVDNQFEEVTEGEEESAKSRLKSRWAGLEAMVGTEKRINKVAADLVDHWERRLAVMDGKAMVVAMSRRIAVALYAAIRKLRPEWHSDDDAEGVMKVIMTGSATDPPAYQMHIRSKGKRKAIEKRFKKAEDPLKIVIVRDMWLTGFNVPSAHTLYVDKPMKGHGLMQAIARVNRVFRDKPAGLVVDYIGLSEFLRKAVDDYGGKPKGGGGPGGQGGETGQVIALGLKVLREKFEVVRAMLHDCDYSGFFTVDPGKRMHALSAAANFVCSMDAGPDTDSEEDAAGPSAAGTPLNTGKRRFFRAMRALNKAFGIAGHVEGARDMVDEIGFFQAVEQSLSKYTTGGSGKSSAELNTAIRQIVSSAVGAGEVVDIFGMAGLDAPDLSILSDEFLKTVQDNPYKNLQFELLKKLISDELGKLRQRNMVQSKKFSEMLDKAIKAYTNRSVEVAAIIQTLIGMAKSMQAAASEGEALGLSRDEKAFYDALTDHGDVKSAMSDDDLVAIAQTLVKTIRNSITIDWTDKDAVRARLRSRVRMLLRRAGYPPDKAELAVVSVIEQAELLAADWAEDAPVFERVQSGQVLPFRKVEGPDRDPWVNCVPLLDLEIAAGGFTAGQVVEDGPDSCQWVEFEARTRPGKDVFIAQVVGESMNRHIPNGAWCVWRLNPGSDPVGKIVLARHQGMSDPETDGRYTVKRFKSWKTYDADGIARTVRVILEPDSLDSSFESIVFKDLPDGELTIVAEMVEVLAK